jgi:hypothetical protein
MFNLLSAIPSQSSRDRQKDAEFIELRTRAFALLPQVWKLYLSETAKTRLLAELFTRDSLELHPNLNTSARTFIGKEVVSTHDTARTHFENWMYLHELVDAKSLAEITSRQYRRAKSIVHEVELFLQHEAAVQESIVLWRSRSAQLEAEYERELETQPNNEAEGEGY